MPVPAPVEHSPTQAVLVGRAELPVVPLPVDATEDQRRARVIAKDVHVEPLAEPSLM